MFHYKVSIESQNCNEKEALLPDVVQVQCLKERVALDFFHTTGSDSVFSLAAESKREETRVRKEAGFSTVFI